MTPTVTVILPHHNRPEMLGRALASVRQQTLPPNEVLIVDDRSTPENQALLQQYAASATLLLLPQNLGSSGARNYGAQQASGEWLAFLDDDDVYLPHKLERQMEYIQAHPEAKALGGGLTMLAPDGHTEYWGGKPTRRLTLADAMRHTASMSQALLIRRDTFLALHGFDTRFRYMEDYELGIRILAAGVPMHFLAEPMFLYHWGGGREQLTRNWRRMFESELQIIHRHRAEARRAFGRLGELRLIAACCKQYGLRRGRLLGRSVWMLGLMLQACVGKLPARAG